MKKFAFFLFSLIPFIPVIGQEEAGQNEQEINKPVKTNKSNTVYGKLINENNGKPIEAASVLLYIDNSNKPDSLFTGMLSKPNGEFKFSDLSSDHDYRLLITALGYDTIQKLIEVKGLQDGDKRFFEKDLGNIVLVSNFKTLEAVTINSSRPSLEMGIDRKIFHVDKSLLATGGTAVDIMKNIPSVSVDIDGNVELRSRSPQIFVDGRPTILALDQIPADHIDRVELITNPSAKFDASSSGGIINVVLKKNKRIGLNGIVSVSGGLPEIFSANINLNVRQGKVNFFATAGNNMSGGKARTKAFRQNKLDGSITDYFNQSTINKLQRNRNAYRFGADFFINNRNTITFSQSFNNGMNGSDEVQDQQYLDKNQLLQYNGVRTLDETSDYKQSGTALNYKYNFPKEGMELTFDINYNSGSRISNADIVNSYFKPDGTEYQAPAVVRNAGNSDETQWTFQTDFVNPVSDKIKIEGGLRSYHNKFNSSFGAYAMDNGQEVKLPLSNNYTYTETINAAYFTYSYKKENFSYQLGVRAEQSKFNGELVDSALAFGYKYPNSFRNIWDALFPSFFITKEISDDDELQFNYSRRIRRPRFWQLNPFVDINDPANIRQGNPQLQPEFSNSFELNYSKDYKNGNFLAVLYYSNNPRDITQYSDTISAEQYQQLNNAAIVPNAILNTYINGGTTHRYGTELTLQHKIGESFEITPTINFQYRTVNATVKDLVLSNRGFNWEAKLLTSYKIEKVKSKLLNNVGFQLIVDYESPQVIPQGKQLAEFDVDFAVGKDLLKDKKMSITFAINDVFNSRRWGTIFDTERFYQNSFRRWRVRTFRLSINYKFGDSKFSLFKNGNSGGGED